MISRKLASINEIFLLLILRLFTMIMTFCVHWRELSTNTPFCLSHQAPALPILRRAMEDMDTRCTAEDTRSRLNRAGNKIRPLLHQFLFFLFEITSCAFLRAVLDVVLLKYYYYYFSLLCLTNCFQLDCKVNFVSKESVVLCRSGSERREFGMRQVDEGGIST